MANTSASSRAQQAAASLAEPSQRGTLNQAYRRSVVALQNVFGFGGQGQRSPSADAQREREREPLLGSGSAEASGSADGAGADGGMPAYGATAERERRIAQGTEGWERRVKKPKQVISPLRVEAKVWFANERTWIAWLRVSLLIGSFAVAMLNSSVFFENRAGAPEYPPHGLYGGGGQGTDDLPPGGPGPELPPPEYGHSDARFIRIFGGLYAIIAVATLLWGLISYQRRVTLIKQKYGGPLDDLVGPPLICLAIFVAVLVNFIFKVKEHNELVR